MTTLHMLLLVHPAIQAKQEGISSVLTADNLTANGWTQYFASDECLAANCIDQLSMEMLV